MRGIQCRTTDPVSFALADGETVARFPDVSGWSALDCARRAVAEHAAWLGAGMYDGAVRGWVAAQTEGAPASAVALGRLFTAARAGLFLESLRAEAQLPLTVRAVAKLLGELYRNSTVVDEAIGSYAAWRTGSGGAPDEKLVDEFAATVSELPAYRISSRAGG